MGFLDKLLGKRNNNIVVGNVGNQNKKVKKGKRYFFKDEMDRWVNNNYYYFGDNYNYYENNCCPNCGVVFEEIVKSSKKCPSCKKKIVVRTNRETSQKLLLKEEQVPLFDKEDENRKDILFFEKKMEVFDIQHPDYTYYFWNLKKEKPDMSPRDYTWSYGNWLFNTLDCELVKKYQRDFKLSFQDRVLYCDQYVFALTHVSYIHWHMISIALYKGQEDVAEEMMLSLIYRSATLAKMYYIHWDDRPFNDIQFYSDASFGLNYVKDYLEKHNMRFEDLRDKFYERAHPFLLNVLNKDEAWSTLCEAYRRYTYLVNTNRFYGED